MRLATMCEASAAYSRGSPRREGNGTCAPRLFCASADRPIIIGVRNRPGAMVQTRMPTEARSRAIGKVMPTTPPFEAE